MYPGNLAFFPADGCTVNIGEKQDNVLCWSFVFFVVGHFGEGWVWVCACFPHKPHHSVDRVASKCFVWHAHQPVVLADPTTDRGFFSQGTLFHGRRIGVRIVTQENRSREDWGSFRFFVLCQMKTCKFDVFWCEDRRENNRTGDNHFPSKACWASVRWSTRIFPLSLTPWCCWPWCWCWCPWPAFKPPNSSLLTPTSSAGPGLTTGKREGGLFKRLSCKKLGKS